MKAGACYIFFVNHIMSNLEDCTPSSYSCFIMSLIYVEEFGTLSIMISTQLKERI